MLRQSARLKRGVRRRRHFLNVDSMGDHEYLAGLLAPFGDQLVGQRRERHQRGIDVLRVVTVGMVIDLAVKQLIEDRNMWELAVDFRQQPVDKITACDQDRSDLVAS